jgi:hypothetical protein|tara:strand:- start:340 stop:525 length:186 start_codon:yes stop_codon:yes gene_type:complete
VAKKDKKLKVKKTIFTVEGTLYENEIVRYVQQEDGHYRVKDSMGKLWFIDKKYLIEMGEQV